MRVASLPEETLELIRDGGGGRGQPGRVDEYGAEGVEELAVPVSAVACPCCTPFAEKRVKGSAGVAGKNVPSLPSELLGQHGPGDSISLWEDRLMLRRGHHTEKNRIAVEHLVKPLPEDATSNRLESFDFARKRLIRDLKAAIARRSPLTKLKPLTYAGFMLWYIVWLATAFLCAGTALFRPDLMRRPIPDWVINTVIYSIAGGLVLIGLGILGIWAIKSREKLQARLNVLESDHAALTKPLITP